MSTITSAEAYLVNIEVETVGTDAMQSLIKQETLFVEIRTADGLLGRGYGYTIGTGGRAALSMLREHLLAPILGQDSREIEAL